MKTLKIDDKWSVTYDPDNNDRPVEVRRYGEPVEGWSEDNLVTAMFYALLEAKPERSLQGQIWDWAFDQFGVSNVLSLAIRGNKEMAELLQEIQTGGKSSKEIAMEAADVGFFLVQICEVCGYEFSELQAEKLAINKERKWALAEDGSFQHVKASHEISDLSNDRGLGKVRGC